MKNGTAFCNKGKTVGLARILICAVVSIVLSSVFAKTCEWQLGGNGNWSDPDNWKDGVTPEAGDIVVIDNSGNAPITVNNDIVGLSLQSVDFKGGTFNSENNEWEYPDTSAITLNGNALTLTGADGVLMANSVYVTVNVPLTVGEGSVNYGTTLTLNGDIKVADDAESIEFNTADYNWDTRHDSQGQRIYKTLYLNGAVSGSQADLRFPSGGGQMAIKVNKTVDVRNIVIANYLNVTFAATGNRYASLVCNCSRVIFSAANATVPAVPFTWTGSGMNLDSWAFYCLYADQTINCLEATEGTQPTDVGCYVYGGNNNQGQANEFMTLTMRATKSASAWCKLGGVWDGYGGKNLNVVYAPQGDFTQTVVGRIHEMKGFLRVEGGTFECGAGSTFPNLSTLCVFPNAKFVIAGTENPFADGQTALEISGKIAVPANMKLIVKQAMSFGVPLDAGTYTAADSAWIEGDGSVQVLNSSSVDGVTYWKAPVSGRWDDETKWTAGVPSRGKKAYVVAEGADYTVALTGEADASELILRNAGDTHTTLEASGAFATMTNVFLTIDRNGRLRVPTGSTFTYSGLVADGKTTGLDDGSNWNQKYGLAVWSGAGSPVKILSTGEFLVDGGFANVTDYNAGNFQVGGDDHAVTGQLTVTAGIFRFHTPNLYQAFYVNHGGAVKVSGTGEFKADRTYKHSFMFCESDAVVEFSDNARLTGNDEWGLPYLNGQVTFKGNAELPASWSFLSYGFTALDTPVLTFGETAHFAGKANEISVGWLGRPTCNVFATLIEPEGEAIQLLKVGFGDDNLTGGSDATLNVKDAYLRVGPDNIIIGASAKGANSCLNAHPSSGTVNVKDGGALVANHIWQQSATYVGYGACKADGVTGHPFVGRLNIEQGGSFTQLWGHVAIGLGYGDGTLSVKGGDVMLKALGGEVKLYVGLAGGIGRLDVSGGTVGYILDWVDSNYVWIGGRPLADYMAHTGATDAGFSSDRHDAQGTLSVSGGTVALPHTYVGVDGSGAIEMVGSAGDLTIQSLDLAKTDGGTTKLSFKLDENGVSPVKVTGEMNIASGVKIEVDARAYEGKKKVKLFSAAEITGEIAQDDITVQGREGVVYKVAVRGTDCYLSQVSGMMMTIR